MKKALSIAIAIVICATSLLALAGCSGDKTNGDTGNAKYKIGIVQLVEHVALDAATEGFFNYS